MIVVAKLMAPMAPFISEHIYRNLVLSVFPNEPESVHLASWPKFDTTLIDEFLLRDMGTLMRVVEMGRAARNAAGIKTRQPLPEVLVRVPSEAEIAGLKRLDDQIQEELNVKSVTYLDVTSDFVDYTVKPNLPLLGKQLGKLLPKFRKKLETIDSREILHNISEGKETVIELDDQPYRFKPEAFLIEARSPENYVALEEHGYLMALNTQLTSELIQEGLVRDAIRLLQNARKKAGLDISDRIYLGLKTSGNLLESLKMHLQFVKNEVLAQEIRFEELEDAPYSEHLDVNGTELIINLKTAETLTDG